MPEAIALYEGSPRGHEDNLQSVSKKLHFTQEHATNHRALHCYTDQMLSLMTTCSRV